LIEPRIVELTPVLGIRSYEEAVAYYIDWLGFDLDWEWREAPDKPVTMAISRGGVSLMLTEDEVPGASWLTMAFANLEALAEEWNGKRNGSVSVELEEPYDIPSVSLRDPVGNRLDFQGILSAEEEAERRHRATLMRDYIRRRIDEGVGCPTPDEIVEAVGRPPGLAVDVLSAFAEYNALKSESLKL